MKINKDDLSHAESLLITLRMVKAHRVCVMRKIGVVSVVDLRLLAFKAGVAPQRCAYLRASYTSDRHAA
jgi:hypothetical protein